MNETEHNFDELKRLLKLKRHEVPPPGYFNRFSGEVISRLQAGENRAHQSFVEHVEDSAPWLVKVLRIFETKPGIIGGFATSLCVILLLGVVFAEYSDNTPRQPLVVANPGMESASSLATLATVSTPLPNAGGGIMIDTNPVVSLQPVASLFGQPGANNLFQPQAQNVSFTTSH